MREFSRHVVVDKSLDSLDVKTTGGMVIGQWPSRNPLHHRERAAEPEDVIREGSTVSDFDQQS